MVIQVTKGERLNNFSQNYHKILTGSYTFKPYHGRFEMTLNQETNNALKY